MRAALVLVLLALVAGSAAAATFTVSAKESGCPEPRSFCFDAGADPVVPAGEPVTLVLKNQGTTLHELVAVPADAADPAHAATPEDDAYGAVEDVEPGTEDSAEVTFPANVDRVYFYCALPGHEQLGMWFEARAVAGSEGSRTDTPLPPLAALAALGAAALALRRR